MKSSAFFFLPLALLGIGSEARVDPTKIQSFMVCNPKLSWGTSGPFAIWGVCPGPDGKPKRTALGLPRCLVNENGVLRGGLTNSTTYEYFVDTCAYRQGSLIGSVYYCKCKDANGKWVNNSIDLEPIMTYRKGNMHCYNQHGIIHPEDDPQNVLHEGDDGDPDWPFARISAKLSNSTYLISS